MSNVEPCHLPDVLAYLLACEVATCNWNAVRLYTLSMPPAGTGLSSGVGRNTLQKLTSLLSTGCKRQLHQPVLCGTVLLDNQSSGSVGSNQVQQGFGKEGSSSTCFEMAQPILSPPTPDSLGGCKINLRTSS